MESPHSLETVDDPRDFLEPANTMAEDRLSIPFHIRFPAATAGAFCTGLALGLSHGGKTAGMRFRAENSHRFPTTPTGWYLYHKSKNYHIMLGGLKEGAKMGSKVAFWTGGFFVVEEAIDRVRDTKDFVSTIVASLSIAGGFSAWSKIFPRYLHLRCGRLMFSRSVSDANSCADCSHRVDGRSCTWPCPRRSGLSSWSTIGLCRPFTG